MLFQTKWHLKVIIAELSRARSGAPWVGKFGYLCIREFLSAPQAYQCKITQSTGMPTQMKLEILLPENCMANRVLCRLATSRPLGERSEPYSAASDEVVPRHMKSDEGRFRKSTSYEAETIKESTKITWKAEIVSISVLSKVLSLN